MDLPLVPKVIASFTFLGVIFLPDLPLYDLSTPSPIAASDRGAVQPTYWRSWNLA